MKTISKFIGKKFGQLSIKDVVKGGILAALTGIVAGLVDILNGISQMPAVYPTIQSLAILAKTGFVVFASYLLKNLMTNSNDQFLKKEEPKDQPSI